MDTCTFVLSRQQSAGCQNEYGPFVFVLKTLHMTLAKPLYSFTFIRLKPGVLKFIGPLLIETIVCSLCQLAVPSALPRGERGRCSEALGSEQTFQLSDCKLTRSSLRGIVRNRPHSCVLCCCSLQPSAC